MTLFVQRVEEAIREGFYAAPLLREYINQMNFWYIRRLDGEVRGTGDCFVKFPLLWKYDCPFGQVGAILHENVCRDFARGDGFSASTNSWNWNIVVVHEFSHVAFDLGDEYDDQPNGCGTGYTGYSGVLPNIWASESLCRNNSLNPSRCHRFTICPNWWMVLRRALWPWLCRYDWLYGHWKADPDGDVMSDRSLDYYDDCDNAIRNEFIRLTAGGGRRYPGGHIVMKESGGRIEAVGIDIVEGGSPEYKLVDYQRYHLELLAPEGSQIFAFSIRDPGVIEYEGSSGSVKTDEWEQAVVVPLGFERTVREVVIYDDEVAEEAGRFDLGPAILKYCSEGGSDEICLGSDLDGDGITDSDDICPLDLENDSDGDGLCASEDNCPEAFSPWQTDTDGDFLGDECDTCPFDADNDLDGDGVCGDADNCPADANADQADFDALGDICDPDVDGDGVLNESDQRPWTNSGAAVDESGCSVDQLCPCDGPRNSGQPWRNQGKYVECVTDVTRDFVGVGLLSRQERAAIISAAARSDCGSK